MIPWLVLGATLGAAKTLSDKKQRDRDTKLKAAEYETAAYTHRDPSTQVHDVDPLGNIAQGGVSGAMMGQSLESFDKNQELTDALIGRTKAGYYTPVSMNVGSGPSLGVVPQGNNPFGLNPWGYIGR
jgi:hypothetical protein